MNPSDTLISTSAEQTISLARGWSQHLPWGSVIGLVGPLGAGKTCFAKGVISGLSPVQPDEITSPTFTIVEEYDGQGKIYHVDLYRLDSPQEAEALPVEDWFSPQAITLIEWPERFPDLIMDCHFLVKFCKEGEGNRQIKIEKRCS